MWILYSLLAALFAALTSIFAKLGLDGVGSNLATAIRTVVVLVLAWGMVFLVGEQRQIGTLTNRNWLFLLLSGAATGASWLFYYRAVQIGEVSKVAPLDKLSIVFTTILAVTLLGESFQPKTAVGCGLIAAGTILMVLK